MGSRSNQVRIIAGQWRGRKLSFPAGEGLRPTSDRMRETLFNWLAPLLPGASCLDLFAGSGALGFEAASRGAARVVMVESRRETVASLRENRQRLSAESVEILQQDAQTYLAAQSDPFDVVFLDPPFGAPALLETSIQMLSTSGSLKSGASIYLEMPLQGPEPSLPESWTEQKRKGAGQVLYRLYRYQAER